MLDPAINGWAIVIASFRDGQPPIAPIVHPKMNTGKEFPSAGIRFPSSPSIVRLAL
jgi:hypothetical protein